MADVPVLASHNAAVATANPRCTFHHRRGSDAESDAEAEVEPSNQGAAGGGGRKRAARRSLLAGSLFTLAVAVVAMLVFKRAKIVRIVRV